MSKTEKPASAKAKTEAGPKAGTAAKPITRATTKARAPAKKTTATRTAAKKAETTKAATKAKPAEKVPPKKAASPAKPAVKSPAKTTSPKPTAKTAKARANSEKKASVSSTSKAVAKPSKKAETPQEDDKPKIAPAPLRPALKVARRAEANRDKNQTFKVRTKIVYPAHGVGYIKEIEKQEIAGHAIELFVIDFEHEKMKLRVPVGKAAASGMRNLSSPERIDEMMRLIEGKARVKRTMWSRRAQEYEAKINSGDLTAVSEVVRDLFRADDQPEQSYSERQLFEQARERFGREVAAVRKKSLEAAIKEIHTHLDKKERPEPAAAAS